MNLSSALVADAAAKGASDIHLEPGLPATYRILSELHRFDDPLTPDDTLAIARELVAEADWPQLVAQCSMDLARTIHGVRCRINILHTARGIGLCVRLLASIVPTIQTLNLNPDLKRLCALKNGLVLISGPTGSGKSSTLAALVQHINQTDARHIITIEYPIEYQFQSDKSFIRQRELGRDVPNMERGLLDAMREDPDVLMIGEMREPESMRLTLNASETGHLVFATIHSSTCAEALQRIISAFPSAIQESVAAQLADCFAAVVCQRLHFNEEHRIRVPECEVLRTSSAIRNFIRRREFHHIPTAIETGMELGMWSLARYRDWMAQRTEWHGATPIPIPQSEEFR